MATRPATRTAAAPKRKAPVAGKKATTPAARAAGSKTPIAKKKVQPSARRAGARSTGMGISKGNDAD
jgi:hypothetical protein